MVTTNNYMRYFMFSSEQNKLMQKIESNLGRERKPRTVIVKGEQKTFTNIVNDPSEMRFSDAIEVAYGDIREMKYTDQD